MNNFKTEKSYITGEPVNLLKVKCKCGHVLSFLSNHYMICTFCGRKVYPSKKCEFKDKLLKEIKKK